MTLTIDLTPEEEARLAAAARQKGVALEECARQLLTEYLPLLTPEEAEDPTLTPRLRSSRQRQASAAS